MKNKSTKNETGAIQIHVYSTGNNIAQTINQTYNGNVYYGQNAAETQEVTDEQMADAISSICGEGMPLDDKQKWMGVCCMVRGRYGYPYDLEACCEKLANLPYKKPLYKECDWGNVRKLTFYAFCREPYDKWSEYCPKNSERKYFDNCFYVARSLEDAIKIIQKKDVILGDK